MGHRPAKLLVMILHQLAPTPAATNSKRGGFILQVKPMLLAAYYGLRFYQTYGIIKAQVSGVLKKQHIRPLGPKEDL